MSPPTRHVYTEEQVNKYLSYVGMKDRISREQCDTEAGLEYLNKLLPLQLAKVPFENLDLHYSPHHDVLLDEDFLFYKIVERDAGRGGYCMQNNSFFATMLRSLGYKIITCGARVSSRIEEPDSNDDVVTYTGWSHQVSLVMIAGKKYCVDVGFGAQCATVALQVEDGWKGRRAYKDFDDVSLERMHIAENSFTNEEQKLWVYHSRTAPDQAWMPVYCFSETEFLPQDFRAMNFYVSKAGTSWFTQTIVVSKFLLDEDGKNIGDLSMAGNVIKERKYGRSQIVAEPKSEAERVHALEMLFGIKLDKSEVNGIKGWVTMLKG